MFEYRYSRIDHMVGSKTSLNKFRRVEITYSNYNRFKYQQERKFWKSKSNIWKLNTFLNNPWTKKKSSLNCIK